VTRPGERAPAGDADKTFEWLEQAYENKTLV
jgi:hypothetical protein